MQKYIGMYSYASHPMQNDFYGIVWDCSQGELERATESALKEIHKMGRYLVSNASYKGIKQHTDVYIAQKLNEQNMHRLER